MGGKGLGGPRKIPIKYYDPMHTRHRLYMREWRARKRQPKILKELVANA